MNVCSFHSTHFNISPHLKESVHSSFSTGFTHPPHVSPGSLLCLGQWLLQRVYGLIRLWRAHWSSVQSIWYRLLLNGGGRNAAWKSIPEGLGFPFGEQFIIEVTVLQGTIRCSGLIMIRIWQQMHAYQGIRFLIWMLNANSPYKNMHTGLQSGG